MTAVGGEPLIGVINAGSSSLKFSVYEGERRLLSGQVDGLGARPSASATGPDGKAIPPPDLGAAPPRTPRTAWSGPVVGEGVTSCPRAGCGKSACPVR